VAEFGVGSVADHPTFGATIGSIAVAAVGVVALTPLAIRSLTRHGVMDRPSARSSHSQATVRGAGLVTGPILAAALVLGWDRLTISLALIALLATMLGALEDVRGISVGARLAGQLVIGAVFLVGSWGVGSALAWPAAVVALLFVVGYTNAFNFMDGINGISVAGAVAAGLAYIALAQVSDAPDLGLPGAALAATAVCFLPFNFPSARIFLGDSGSYSFGAVIACAAVAGWRAGVRADAIVAPLVIYLADTGTVVARRLWRREPVAAPHRTHAYQRLVQLGASHAQSTAVVLACTIVTSVLGLATARAGMAARAALDIAIIAVAVLYLALPTLVAHGRKSPPAEAL
jgi:UDP-GlcNAc:undecaprenyl-phosphate/decaprenyl-phosphate GlcNAc-1-phosphate transferase